MKDKAQTLEKLIPYYPININIYALEIWRDKVKRCYYEIGIQES